MDAEQLKVAADKACHASGEYVIDGVAKNLLAARSELHACIDAMQAEIDRLRKDAIRYRWLRSNFHNGFFLDHLVFVNDFDPMSGDEVDAAIDAALSEEAKGTI